MLIKLTNTSLIFKVVINIILYKYLDIYIIAYLDNILIYLKETLKEYI